MDEIFVYFKEKKVKKDAMKISHQRLLLESEFTDIVEKVRIV